MSSFRLVAYPKVMDAVGSCGHDLIEIPNGWFEKAYYCERCESVYQLKMVKLRKDKVDYESLKEILERRNGKV